MSRPSWHFAETLEAGAAAGHLLDADDIGALLGRLETRHKAADAGTHDHDLMILGGRDLIGGDGVGHKGDGATRAGAGRLLHGNPGRLVGQLGDGRHGTFGLIGHGRGHPGSGTAGQSEGSCGDAHGAGTAQEVATGYVRSLHSSSFASDSQHESFYLVCSNTLHGLYIVKFDARES